MFHNQLINFNSQFNVNEFFALRELYGCTSGDFWDWENPFESYGYPWFGNNTNPCDWQGIFCNSNNSNIIEINLVQYNLQGFLPESIGQFTQLISLTIAYNEGLRGTIPIEIGNLENLQILDLEHNSLSGTIPTNLGNQLLLIDLNTNFLTGQILNFENFSELYWVGLGSNTLSGTINNLNVEKLEYFSINNNFFTGFLPEISTNLSYLIVNHNYLSGNIPKLNINLIDVHLSYNYFSGILPQIDSKNIFFLMLDFNLLSGSISNDISKLENVNMLILNDNFFSSSIPNLSKLENLNMLLIENNKFSGNLDEVFDPKMKNLEVVKIYNNQITGILPEAIFQLKNLNTLVAHVNCFSNTLPQSICNATNMKTLILNGLSSASSCRKKIMPEISKSYYTEKNVGGIFPKCIFDLPDLSTLQISGNGLSGNIQIDKLSKKLLDLSLSHNKLTGNLPTIIQEKKFKHLDLSFNYFSGSLMDSFNTYGEINNTDQTYSLQNNIISGFLPLSVIELENINILDGNLFNCNLNRKDLPKNDINVNKYQCGSNSFNIEYFLWICLLLIYILIKYRVWSVGTNSLKLETITDNLVFISKKFTLFIVFLLLPFYIISSVYSGTYNNQYVWFASAAFLKGIIPFTFLFIFFSCLIITLFFINNNQIYNSTTNTSSKTVSFIYIIINLFVVISVNCVYVYTTIYQNNNVQIISQIMLSCFKIVWNGYISLYILKNLSMKINKLYLETEYIFLQIFISFFNNIVIPVLVVMCIDSKCFYNVFQNVPEVKSTFQYEICEYFNINGVFCESMRKNIENSSYDPPFTYSYQCSASIVTHYSVPFLSMCIISSFINPLIQLILSKSIIPKVIEKLIIRKKTYKSIINKSIINIMSYLGLILTFGTVFPPLAVCLLMSILVISYSIKFEILEEDNLNNEINEQHNQIISSIWILIIIIICFYTMFLFDTLGGLKNSYWLLIFSMICCVLTGVFFIKSLRRKNNIIKDEIFNIL